jgi:hypothetical protein
LTDIIIGRRTENITTQRRTDGWTEGQINQIEKERDRAKDRETERKREEGERCRKKGADRYKQVTVRTDRGM